MNPSGQQLDFSYVRWILSVNQVYRLMSYLTQFVGYLRSNGAPLRATGKYLKFSIDHNGKFMWIQYLVFPLRIGACDVTTFLDVASSIHTFSLTFRPKVSFSEWRSI